MNTTTVQMKGSVTACYAENSKVYVWVASPTGDVTDAFCYNIPCLTQAQAEVIAEMWRKVWGI
jgi:hypothetical protein